MTDQLIRKSINKPQVVRRMV